MPEITADAASVSSGRHLSLDRLTSRPRIMLIIGANLAVSTHNNRLMGLGGAQLSHPHFELTEVGFEVTIASHKDGRVEITLSAACGRSRPSTI